MSGGSSGWMSADAYERDSEEAWATAPELRTEHQKRIVQSDCDMHNAMLADRNWKAYYTAKVFIITWAALLIIGLILKIK